LNQLPGPSSNKIYTDIGATRSSVVLRFVLIGKPLAVIHLGSNIKASSGCASPIACFNDAPAFLPGNGPQRYSAI